MKFVTSASGVQIHLTAERMEHIARRHPEMAGQEGRILETIATPDLVQEGDLGTLLAIRLYPRTPLTTKYCVVVYRETDARDGFVVTSYFATKPSSGRSVKWKR